MTAQKLYVPVTPTGRACHWLAANSEHEAWSALMKDVVHKPYKTQDECIKGGYRIERIWVTKEKK